MGVSHFLCIYWDCILDRCKNKRGGIVTTNTELEQIADHCLAVVRDKLKSEGKSNILIVIEIMKDKFMESVYDD